MKTPIVKVLKIAAAGLLGIPAWSDAAGPPTNQPPKILIQPKTRIAEVGTHVDFAVKATNFGYTLSYQWLINGVVIPGATNKMYCLENVQMSNVATYSVTVTGNGSTNSKPAHLSVYSLFCTNSNGGTMSTPIGAFGTQSSPCGASFNRAYCPIDGNGNFQFFYGPNTSGQTGPFQNTSLSPYLTIDTFSPANSPADTGIQLQKNWDLSPPACCNDTAVPPSYTYPLAAKCGPTTLHTGTHSRYKYRLTVLYKSPPGPPSSGIFTFNWLYHD